mmetsp:Transcript_85264/g.266799  ORF Transcript_85264/g.266799 Transcript_85264/m.266799 type:complete len:103 (+) Transcript_85264:127-435(+)
MSVEAAPDEGCESDATDPEMPELVPAPAYNEPAAEPVAAASRKSAPVSRSLIDIMRNEGLSEEQSMALAMAMSGARFLPVRPGGPMGGPSPSGPGDASTGST